MVSEMKNYFGGLMSRCDTAKESMNEFKVRSTETTKIVTQRKIIKSNKGKTTNNIQGNSHKVNS